MRDGRENCTLKLFVNLTWNDHEWSESNVTPIYRVGGTGFHMEYSVIDLWLSDYGFFLYSYIYCQAALALLVW
jgi:hypothetical protein